MKHNIICHDGKSFEISEEQKEAFYTLSGTGVKGIDVNGTFIFFNSVSRVEKSSIRQYKPLPKEIKRTYKKEQHIKNLETLKEGYLKGVSDRNNLKKNQETFIERVDKAVQAVINSSEKEFIIDNKLFGY